MTTTDGVPLNETVRLLRSNAATYNVTEVNAQSNWEELRHNQPLYARVIVFSVHNGSGLAIDHLVAQYSVESPWPPCTNWTERFELEVDFLVLLGEVAVTPRAIRGKAFPKTPTRFPWAVSDRLAHTLPLAGFIYAKWAKILDLCLGESGKILRRTGAILCRAHVTR